MDDEKPHGMQREPLQCALPKPRLYDHLHRLSASNEDPKTTNPSQHALNGTTANKPSRLQSRFPDCGSTPNLERSMSILDVLTRKCPASCELVIGRLQRQGTKVKTKHSRRLETLSKKASDDAFRAEMQHMLKWIALVVRPGQHGRYLRPCKGLGTFRRTRTAQ